MLKSKAASCIRVILLLLALVLVSGCGASSGSSGTTVVSSSDAAVGSKPFLKYSKQKEIVTFGEEASLAERDAASAVLAENLKARAAAEFAPQCDSLGKAGIEKVAGEGQHDKAARSECPAVLKKLAEPLKDSQGIRTDTLTGPIAALRIKGDKAYALFHGNDGHDYAMPMEKEDGDWRVGAIILTPLG